MKKIVWIVILVLIGAGGWKLYSDYQLFLNGDGTPYTQEIPEDNGVYSSYEGNVCNGSDLFVNENGETIAYFRSVINRGDEYGTDYIANLTTGKIYYCGKDANVIGTMNDRYKIKNSYENICIYEGAAYVTQFVGGKNDEEYQLQKVDLASGHTTVLHEGMAYSLMVADGVLYFKTPGDVFYSMDIQTLEKKLIAEDVGNNYCFYNGVLYFLKSGTLYGMNLASGETTQIGEYTCVWFFIHQGKIYYEGWGYGVRWFMSMNLDGTDNQAHMRLDVRPIGMHEGKIYYRKQVENVTDIYYIDVNNAELIEQKLLVKENAAQCLKNYYALNIEKWLRQFPDLNEGSEVVWGNIERVSIRDGYMLFQADASINQWNMSEAFLYNLETGEVKLVNEMLGLDIIYDYYLR